MANQKEQLPSNVVAITPDKLKVGMLIYGASGYDGDWYSDSRWGYADHGTKSGWEVKSIKKDSMTIHCKNYGGQDTKRLKEYVRLWVDVSGIEPEFNEYGEVCP